MVQTGAIIGKIFKFVKMMVSSIPNQTLVKHTPLNSSFCKGFVSRPFQYIVIPKIE
jgi:hypothetical protein